MISHPDRTWDDWHAEGRRRFGFDFGDWWFYCPECHLAFQAGLGREAGVYEDYLGCLCPKGIGGCGYPQTLGKKMGSRRFKLMDGQERARLTRMIGLEKDSPGRVKMRVLPFCPDASIPIDGRKQVKLEPCEYCGHPFEAEALGPYGCPNCCGEPLERREA